MTHSFTLLNVFLGGVSVLLIGGVACAAASAWRGVSRIGVLAAVVGSLAAGVSGAVAVLTGRTVSLDLAWRGMPFTSIPIGLDPLSGWFLCVVALLGLLGAVYGAGYWREHCGRRALGFGWTEYLVLLASMMGVVVARDAVGFLVAWEIMSLTSFLLVLFDRHRSETREAGWVYLAAAHLGAACLLVMFLLLGREGGSLAFSGMGVGLTPGMATAVFVLAVLGFGSKAGFVPMHIWLPEAHPAAPSHVSALMSGVMVKMGIYGILRVVLMLGTPPAGWGWTLLAIGAVSGVIGVVFALAQPDLKRMLAYSSVENVGIITVGLGLGMLGWSQGNAALAAIGFAGALLHVVNHAVFKGLLFMAAGSVLHATQTRNMDTLGGLMRRMPTTGALFFLGAAAICGLPPLNGFVSEFLLYLASFREVASVDASVSGRLAGIVALMSLCLIGGLAVACFVKAAGMVFLGEPRSAAGETAHESPRSMLVPMAVLGGLCIAIGLGGAFLLQAGWNAVLMFPFAAALSPEVFEGVVTPLRWVGFGGGVLIAVVILVAGFRRWMLMGKPRGCVGTWDCGYVAPSSRMQYTASSFSAPLLSLFRPFLQMRVPVRHPDGIFPTRAALRSHTADVFRSLLFRPVFRFIEGIAVRLRPLQHGRIQVYVLYVALTLIILLIWKLR